MPAKAKYAGAGSGAKAKRELFCQEFSVSFNASDAARKAGFSAARCRATGSELLTEPEVQLRLAEIIRERSAKIQSAEFDVLAKVREVVDRCMQAAPVYDRKGEQVEGGVWQFEPAAALRGLELLGKHEGLFSSHLDITVTEAKAKETIKRALTIIAKRVTPEVFRAIVADLEGAGDA